MFYRASELNPLNKVTVDPYPDSPVLFKENQAHELKAKSKL
jgi:acyl-CoA oxidase